MPAPRLLSFALAGLMLSGCGGGGETTPVYTDAPTVNVARAWQSLLEDPRTDQMSARGYSDTTLQTETFEATIVYSPRAAENFALTGTSLRSGAQVGEVRLPSRGGAVIGRATLVTFHDAQFQPMGLRFTGALPPDTCFRSNARSNLPGLRNLPARGEIARYDWFDGCSSGTLTRIGAALDEWFIQLEGAVPFFCRITTFYDGTGVATSGAEYCYEALADGRLGPRARARVVADLHLQNFRTAD